MQKFILSCFLVMIAMTIIVIEMIDCQLLDETYSITSFSSTVTVSDDCFTNIIETFTIQNTGSKPLTQFSRFIKRENGNSQIVSRSIQIEEREKGIYTFENFTLVYSEEFIEVKVISSDPIERNGNVEVYFAYQTSSNLIIGDINDMVKLNYAGPIAIFPTSISIKFTDQVKYLHGYRQFQITPHIETITTLTENSVSWKFDGKSYKNPNLQVEFPSLKVFDICRAAPMDSVLSISIFNLLAILLLLFVQFGIIIVLCISRYRSVKRAIGFENENTVYGSL